MKNNDLSSLRSAVDQVVRASLQFDEAGELTVAWACCHNNLEMFRYVRDTIGVAETELTTPDCDNNTCADYACHYANVELLSEIHALGGAPPSVLQRRVEGEDTCALLAVWQCSIPLLNWLKQHGGITPEILRHEGADGMCCAEMALCQKNREVFRWVEEEGGANGWEYPPNLCVRPPSRSVSATSEATPKETQKKTRSDTIDEHTRARQEELQDAQNQLKMHKNCIDLLLSVAQAAIPDVHDVVAGVDTDQPSEVHRAIQAARNQRPRWPRTKVPVKRVRCFASEPASKPSTPQVVEFP